MASRFALEGNSSLWRLLIIQEGLEGVVELPESVTDVKRMLEYIYTGDYTPESGDTVALLASQISLYIIADKYDVQTLKKEALRDIQIIYNADLSSTGRDLEVTLDFAQEAIDNLTKEDPLYTFLANILATYVKKKGWIGLDQGNPKIEEGAKALFKKFTNLIEDNSQFAASLFKQIWILQDREIHRLREINNRLGSVVGFRDGWYVSNGHCPKCPDEGQMIRVDLQQGDPAYDIVCERCGQAVLYDLRTDHKPVRHGQVEEGGPAMSRSS